MRTAGYWLFIVVVSGFTRHNAGSYLRLPAVTRGPFVVTTPPTRSLAVRPD